MKKNIIRLLCLTMLLSCMALSVSAASAHMRISGSSSTVYRGDTISLTVTLSNDQPVAYGGIVLGFDSSVFEITGGSCHVSGATLAEVSAARGGGTFILQNDTVVSGTIFTINLRVKSDAPFGRYSISGSGSINGGGCGVSGTSVTVACKHTYGSAVKTDDSTHQSTCTICGEQKSEKHTWNSGTVTKAATCKDTGTKLLQCTGCGAEKTETIPVTNDHQYGKWSKVDNKNHTHKCSVCGKQETVDHTWNDGRVDKKATCQEKGSKTLTCTGCAATKKAEIPKADHSYNAWTKVDDNSHTHTCTVCDKVETLEHRYSDAWEHDANGHFQRCEDCGNTKDWAVHVPGPEPTETTDQLCTVCDRMLRPNTAHDHSFDSAWISDELGHWHQCALCDEQQSFAVHAFLDDCDGACDVCGAEREAPHVPGGDWSADESGHWRICESCGEKADFASHTPGPAATTSSAQICTDCQFVIVPVLPHDHVYNASGSIHAHACACGELYEADAKTCEVCLAENRPFPWWIVCIVEAIVFGGAIAFLILRIRKKETETAQSTDA